MSEEEIDEGLARVKRIQGECTASNALVRSQIVAARKEVAGGRKFEDVAARYSREGREEALEWESYQLGELPEESPLRQFLAKAKAGEISDLIEWDDGLMFVKVLKVKKGDAPDGEVEPDEYEIGRIVVNIWDRPDDMTRDEVRAELLKWKEQKAQESLGERLFREAVLEFPNGTNWFVAVSSGI